MIKYVNMIEYTREQFLELYNDLPEQLKNAMGSDRTTDVVERLSNQESLDDDQHSAFVKLVGDLLLGLVPPSSFKKELTKAKIKKGSADKIELAVKRFILYPVKELIADLYDEEIVVPTQKKSSKSGASDKYREGIE